ncbi:hypothetical protein KL86PLE_60158 [uncultured Pleomorphomonas sp.]|uniref:Uncharacterized protein n=1 Tax=uncultured Pleomorphomonas sp. TaxID=442121 RepID=A0A212LJY9_9HYPH|nr:hypothetical protein KL86PLE_60158 [uncultured Pleomorphomonas sp.]
MPERRLRFAGRLEDLRRRGCRSAISASSPSRCSSSKLGSIRSERADRPPRELGRLLGGVKRSPSRAEKSPSRAGASNVGSAHSRRMFRLSLRIVRRNSFHPGHVSPWSIRFILNAAV